MNTRCKICDGVGFIPKGICDDDFCSHCGGTGIEPSSKASSPFEEDGFCMKGDDDRSEDTRLQSLHDEDEVTGGEW